MWPKGLRILFVKIEFYSCFPLPSTPKAGGEEGKPSRAMMS